MIKITPKVLFTSRYSKLKYTPVLCALLSGTAMAADIDTGHELATNSTEENAITVAIQIDPSYQHSSFQGWGTSLVWFANATGGYPDEIRNKLVDMLFSREGLNLNIARYNIGGGNAPDVRKDYMKVGATMEGFWQAPEGITQQHMDWWNPENPEHWNWQADANQRWWIDQIKHKVDIWEAFSNSPPWFQTVSGYVSGGFNSSTDQIRLDTLDDFATYLVTVTEFIEQAHGIKFDSIDPLNEPNTPYWGTTLGDDGQPVGGRQEGAHAGPALQQAVILALDNALADADTNAMISAMDETNPGRFRDNWNAYSDEAKAAVKQLNVHTYGTSSRTSVRDIAKGERKPLWMSEVEGSFYSPTDYTTMANGLGMAQRIVNDIRELEPSAWVFWQPIEDVTPQANANKNWGSIHVSFECTDEDTLVTCPIKTNSKFNTIRNFTHYIRPGDKVVKVNNSSTLAAIGPFHSAKVVYINSETAPHALSIDLSKFGYISHLANVTPVITDINGTLAVQPTFLVTEDTVEYTVPAESVTTLLIKGVIGVSPQAPLIKEGHRYRLTNVRGGLTMSASNDGSCVNVVSEDLEDAEQLWQIQKLDIPGTFSNGFSHRERFSVTNVDNGKLLVADGKYALLDSPADSSIPDESAQWMMSTVGNGTWTLINVGNGRLLDLWGNGPDGCLVNTWTANSGNNQRWTITDIDI